MSNNNQNRSFRLRKLYIVLFVLLLIVVIIGLIGFRYIVKLEWIDSFQNTMFYVSGMGPLSIMQTPIQKLFSGTYALISGLVFVAIAAYIIDAIVDLEFLRSLTDQ